MSSTLTINGSTISLWQGDTGELTITGLPTDQDYTVYFGVFDPDSGTILGQVSDTSGASSSMTLSIPASFTDDFIIFPGETSRTFKWRIKRVDGSGNEYTDSLSGYNYFSNEYDFVLYRKQVEGAS